jgi:hypothetical protein
MATLDSEIEIAIAHSLAAILAKKRRKLVLSPDYGNYRSASAHFP